MGTQGKLFHAKSDKKKESIDTHSHSWTKALFRLHATPLFVCFCIAGRRLRIAMSGTVKQATPPHVGSHVIQTKLNIHLMSFLLL